MINSSISININGEIQSFEIGESKSALKAIDSYIRYQTDHKYEDLKDCFAYLHYTVREAPERKLNACRASHALAFSTFPLLNIYRQFFIANSVSSIIVNADLCDSLTQIKYIWDMVMYKNGQEMEKNGLDEQAAVEAGLAVFSVNQ